ncbi:MAG TPA: glycosyltransferase family 4 protein, partial [Thermoanaerobaculia bacterium]
MTSVRPRRFVFISGNRTWGGSEELWSASAAVLAAQGHSVAVFKSVVDTTQPRLRKLRDLGVRTADLTRFPFTPAALFRWLGNVSRPAQYAYEVVRLWLGLRFSRRPDLVVLSQGGNFDGFLLAGVLRRLRMPYVVICQKATDLYWPPDVYLEPIRRMFASAIEVFFVAQHNRRVTEEQLGAPLPRARVVRNPFLVAYAPREDWPDESHGFRLACIGRLHPLEKGQDLLLRVLARDRWRERALSVTFVGGGAHRDGLVEMARHLELKNVTFAGFIDDPQSIWNDHHALVLPSRCEGLPLVIVEAMLSARVPIITNVGGNTEVIEDGVSGFVANAAAEDALDDAMNRAWLRRDEWRAIGAVASHRIRELV